MTYSGRYPEGTFVKIAAAPELERFRKEWRFYHKLEPKQLGHAGKTARVKRIGFYHGSDVLYELENVPGIRHEVCLRASEG